MSTAWLRSRSPKPQTQEEDGSVSNLKPEAQGLHRLFTSALTFNNKRPQSLVSHGSSRRQCTSFGKRIQRIPSFLFFWSCVHWTVLATCRGGLPQLSLLTPIPISGNILTDTAKVIVYQLSSSLLVIQFLSPVTLMPEIDRQNTVWYVRNAFLYSPQTYSQVSFAL